MRKGKLELSLCYRSDQEALKIGIVAVRSLCYSGGESRVYIA